MYRQTQLAQISLLLKGVSRGLPKEPPGKGWLRAIRDALGMSSYQLAKRLGVNQKTVIEWEQREGKGTISLKSLKKVADALQCDVVYALVPRKPLPAILRERASGKAAAIVGQAGHSMSLEAQQTSPAFKKKALKETVRRLLDGNPRRLWDS